MKWIARLTLLVVVAAGTLLPHSEHLNYQIARTFLMMGLAIAALAVLASYSRPRNY